MGIGDTGTQTFIVTPDAGGDEESYEVTIDLRDVRQWERVHPRNTMRKLVENPAADDILSLVYMGIKRQRLRELPPVTEWIEDTLVVPKPEPMGAQLDRTDLAEVIDKALNYPDVTSVTIADMVMDYLERLQGREPDPTQRAR